MTQAKVLIKFIGKAHAANIVPALALEPELYVPVGFGEVLSDTSRNRYNHFFHHREMETVLTDPVRLGRSFEETESALGALLAKYAPSRPVVDVTDADVRQSMALGRILEAHPEWYISVMASRIADGRFDSLINADFIRRLPFPKLTEGELSFLRYGGGFEERVNPEAEILRRRDLTKETVRLIQSLSRVYNDRPGFWREVASRLARTSVGLAPGKREYLIDGSELSVRDEAFEELVERGILSKYVRRNGIYSLTFPDAYAAGLLIRISQVPVFRMFLEMALVKDYGDKAAYHDLRMIDCRFVTGIRGCVPTVLALYRETDGVEAVFRFRSEAAALYEEPARRILVKDSGLEVPDEVAEAAENLSIELTDAKKLPELLSNQ